ncbi:hypothetical protein [Thermofilum pendens]|uniref:Uncharacterized protein n=1 Tax=Thermofilum pendens (strain DSM 2475 / Hrk 5) TaxID=368408 RepID=A1RZQ0_THEPD|nr:hypothetical protein [Thermofilum pendens]ABL78680.1 hypothetical protein Tpen_1282 [Thermofilum pendens Hrk 5]
MRRVSPVPPRCFEAFVDAVTGALARDARSLAPLLRVRAVYAYREGEWRLAGYRLSLRVGGAFVAVRVPENTVYARAFSWRDWTLLDPEKGEALLEAVRRLYPAPRTLKA